jgi:hypothetical protein
MSRNRTCLQNKADCVPGAISPFQPVTLQITSFFLP